MFHINVPEIHTHIYKRVWAMHTMCHLLARPGELFWYSLIRSFRWDGKKKKSGSVNWCGDWVYPGGGCQGTWAGAGSTPGGGRSMTGMCFRDRKRLVGPVQKWFYGSHWKLLHVERGWRKGITLQTHVMQVNISNLLNFNLIHSEGMNLGCSSCWYSNESLSRD